jgi:hypothetical protein
VQAGLRVAGTALVTPGGRRLEAGRLEMPSLAELRARAPAPRPGPLRLSEVWADVQALHADPAHAGAVFQVASQFNLLEMVSPRVTPEAGIAGYVHDRTQGPACAVACAAGTLWRAYFVPVGGGTGQSAGRQLDMAAGLHGALGGTDAAPLWDMVNGYLLPRPGGLARAAEAIAAGDRAALTGALRVGVQHQTEVTLPGCGHRVTQVYASACPVAYAPAPSGDADWAPLARLVLEAAYEATLRVAAEAGAPLFLTRLGGGAFGNAPDWIDAAIDTACARLEGSGLEIRLVSYAPPERPVRLV